MHGGGDLGHGDTRAAGVYSGDAGCQLSCSTLLRRRIAAQAAVAEALWFLVEQTETSEAARGRWTVAAGTYAISTRWLVGQFTRGRACRRAVVCVCMYSIWAGRLLPSRRIAMVEPWNDNGHETSPYVGARGPPTKQIRFSVFPRPRTLFCCVEACRRGVGKSSAASCEDRVYIMVLILARRQGCAACSARLAACAARLMLGQAEMGAVTAVWAGAVGSMVVLCGCVQRACRHQLPVSTACTTVRGLQ